MPQRAGIRCSFPGCPEPSGRMGRCTRHRRQANMSQHRTTPTKVARADPKVRAHRKAAVEAHVAAHGWRCLGDQQHPAHYTRDLVADDPVAIARGGDPMQSLKVMCRRRNSQLGARPR